jgi:uncharacterized damage-inducible protein DinB
MGTLSSDPIEIMLAHDEWATRELLGACRALSREQFHRPFEIGLGSLHNNLSHIIGVVGRWSDRLMGRTPRPALHSPPGMTIPTEARERTVDELLGVLGVASRDLREAAAASRKAGLDQLVTLMWPSAEGPPERYTFTHGAVYVHLSTHNAGHRSQCVNMLRRLGAPGISDRLPELGVIDWQAAVESPPVVGAG